MRKKVEWEWKEDQEEAFAEVKRMLTNPEFLIPCTIIQKVNRFSAMLQQGVTFCFIDIHLHVKFQKKLMSSLRRSLEADGHTRSITMDYYYGQSVDN